MSRLVNNFGAVVVSYIAAVAAAAIAYILLLVAGVQLFGHVEHPSELPILQQISMLFTLATLLGLFIAVLAFIPAMLAVALLSLLRLRDVVSHMIAGVAVTAGAVMLAARYVLFMERLEVDWLLASAGAAGGAAFWAVFRKLANDNRPPRGAPPFGRATPPG